jgi:hypothetical protein
MLAVQLGPLETPVHVAQETVFVESLKSRATVIT